MEILSEIKSQIAGLESVGFTPTDMYIGSEQYHSLRQMDLLPMHGVNDLYAFCLKVHVVVEKNHLMVAGKREPGDPLTPTTSGNSH